MTRLCFKYDLIKKELIPKIENIIEDLTIIKLKLEQLNIPNDFKYLQYLKSLDEKIDSYKEIYYNIIDNIELFNKELTIEFNDLQLSLASIKDINNLS